MSTAYGDSAANTHAQTEIARAHLKHSNTIAVSDERQTHPRIAAEAAPLRGRIAAFVAVVQTILFLGHWFVYETWVSFWGTSNRHATEDLRWALAILSVSFVAATLLAHRFNNAPVRVLYRIAAGWLGFLNFFFFAAFTTWIAYVGGRIAGLSVNRPILALVIFGAATCTALYGIANARWIRVRRISVRLPNLPAAWRGRVAALVSDVHLGHVNGAGFMRCIVEKLKRLQPDIVFIPGDLYDGTRVDPAALAAPWKEFSPKFGTYFVTGNHEEFTDPRKYLDGVRSAGVGVLNNEKVVIDGLQVVGVHFSDTTREERFQSVLARTQIDRRQASILLSHAPHALDVVERAGISLQLSGHTHGGQIFPSTWFTKRIFGPFTYGLQQYRNLAVFTTSGIGTWGPPLRVGTSPEIVLIQFD
jgi:predicted MPP superfamily phosphohydrolase